MFCCEAGIEIFCFRFAMGQSHVLCTFELLHAGVFCCVHLGIGAAFFIAESGILRSLLTKAQEVQILGSFFAGIFFTSLFTIEFAMVAIVELAEMWASFYLLMKSVLRSWDFYA